ncbi:molybdate ABC transporter substrate-binding protein [Demequina silvatica]|uniref:molybdate ABC transporter substrate-binding protein n=1 Tax=Demequina silvatica TaxID=1638988 RepID=UPI000783B319|nr:molybdate ABC transporter substrate-binding protein [Demequina silvatica]
MRGGAGPLAVAGSVAALALSLTACTNGSADRGAASLAPGSEDTTLWVLAAASLTEVLEEIAEGFEADHPGVDVVGNYAGSSDLAAQLLEGAPADVFISADEANMDKVEGLVAGTPTVVATNTLTIVVPEGNRAGVAGLADLADDAVVTVVCAPQVPCGAATAALAAGAGVTLSPASEEQNVTDVLGKVSAGQADAGIVYVTDVARGYGVEAVPIDGAGSVVNRYPAAALTRAAQPALAQEFVAYLGGPEAQAVLAAAGFGAP